MSQCPKCQTAVPENAFGLYTCTNCRAVMTVDMEGRTSLEGSGALETAPPSVIKQSETSPEPIPDYLMDPEPISEAVSESQDSSDPSEKVIIEEIKEQYGQVAEPEDFTSRTVSISGEAFVLPDREADLSSSSFDDVVKFAESPVSSAAEGAFLYDVLLEGIDSEDLKSAVREALRDERFGWKVEEEIRRMRRGTLLLAQLNPVKASLLISRLKSYPLKITWSQNGLME